jgi:threonine/homoserine/homoserine lactone efflux protein
MGAWSVLLLAAAMFVLAVTPGPGVFATVARALASGFVPAAELVIGIVMGDLVYLLLAIFGLGALATLLGDLFVVVKYAGAAYLLWLGWRLWTAPPVDRDALRQVPNSRTGNLLTGLLITLANPKVILFYLGLLPTFIDLNALTATDIVIVALVVSGVLGLTMLGYALIASRARELVRNTRVARTMNRTAGGAMILAGATLATKA